MIYGHKLKWTQQPDGKWVAECSCKQWSSFGKNKNAILNRWNKKHINPLDNWK